MKAQVRRVKRRFRLRPKWKAPWTTWGRKLMGTAITAVLLAAQPAYANPSGPTVRHGNVQITPGAQAQIQQLTDKAIVDWQSFSIGINESVRFLQPGQLSVILNRVVGQDPSHILGRLEANGNVFLINPNGILFGPNSVVNVGGLVASTLSITDEDFLAARYNFFQDSETDLAAVVNQGQIVISDAGFALLTGPLVSNEGTILARTGTVTLAAGEQGTLNLDGRDLVHFAMENKVGSGPVLLAPGSVSDVLAGALGVHSQNRANRLVRLPDGTVRLEHGSGSLLQAGTVAADGAGGQQAGTVVLNSTDLTRLTAGSVTSASGAGEDSAGGQVLVLSAMDGSRDAQGFSDVQAGATLAASGGTSGDGGFIEVSGDNLNLAGDVDLSASAGQAGSFLLDPITVTIVDGTAGPAPAANVVLSGDTEIGDAWFTTLGFTTFTLESTGNIVFDLAIKRAGSDNNTTLDFTQAGGRMNLTLRSGTDAGDIGGIDFGDDGITYQGLNSLSLFADGDVGLGDGTFLLNGPLNVTTTGGGNVDLGTSSVTIDTTSTSPLNITSSGSLDLGDGSLDIVGRNGSSNATSNLTATGAVTMGGFDFDARNVANGNREMNLNLMGATVTGGDDSVAATLANTFAVGGTFDVRAQAGGINLPDMDLLLLSGSGTREFNLTATSTLLLDGNFVLEDDVNINVTGAATLDTLTLGVNGGGSILITAGSVSAQNSMFNPTVGGNSTGRFVLNSGGDVNLTGTSINLDNSSSLPLVVTSGGTLSLDGAAVDINGRNSSISSTSTLMATGDINLGSFDFDSRNLANSNRAMNLTIDGATVTGSNDGSASTFANTFALGGTLNVTGQTGSISLPDLDLDILTGSGTRELNLTSNGNLILGGDLVLEDTLMVNVPGSVTMDSITLDMNDGGAILVTAGGPVSAQNSTFNPTVTAGSAGRFVIDSGGDLNLTGTTINLDNSSNLPLVVTSGGTLTLDGAAIDINARNGSSNSASTLMATGDIILGSFDFDARNLANFNRETSLTIDGATVTGGNDGSALSFANTFALGGTLDVTAQTGSILLPDLDLDVLVGAGTRQFNLTSNGNLVLGGDFVLEDAFTVNVPGTVAMDSLTLDVNAGGDISVTAGGAISAQNSVFNPTVTAGSTGRFVVDSGGDVNLTGTTINLDNSSNLPFSVTAGGTLSLDGAAVDINGRNGSSNSASTLMATGDINLGSFDFDSRNLANSNREMNLTIDGATVTGSNDGSASTFANTFVLGGTLNVTGQTGSISLPDLDLDILTGSGTREFNLTSNGNLILGGDFVLEDTLMVNVPGSVAMDNITVDMNDGGAILVTAGGSVSAQNSTFNPVVSAGSAGRFVLDSGGDLNLTGTTINLDNSSNVPLVLASGGTLDLDGATVDINGRNGSSNSISTFTATGDINLGSFDFDARNLANGNREMNLTLDGASVTSGPSDGMAGTFVNDFTLGGTLDVTSRTGGVAFNDMNLFTLAGSGTRDFNLNVATDLVLGGVFNLQDDFTVAIPGSVTMDDLTLSIIAGGDVSVMSGGAFSAQRSVFNPTVTAGSTGRFVVGSGGDVNLTGTTINLDNSSNVPLVLTSGGTLDLDGAAVDINGRNGGNNSISTFTATGDINLGSFDFDARNLANGNREMNLTLDGASVTSGPSDGMAGTFVNDFTLGGTLDVTSRTGEVAFNDMNLFTLAGSGTRDFNLNVATDLVLGGVFNLQDDFTVTIPGSVTLDDLTLSIIAGGDVSVTAGGPVSAQNSVFNPTVTTNSTGRFVVNSGGDVNLTGTTVNLDNSSNVPLVLTSGGTLDLDGAAVDINGRNGGNNSISTFTATGDINLGSFDFDAQNLANGNREMGLTIDGASVTSGPSDGMAGTFVNDFTLGGTLDVTSRTGGVAFNDMNLLTLPGSGTRDFNLNVATDLVLGGVFNLQDDFTVAIPGAVTLDDLTLSIIAGGDVSVTAGGPVSAQRSVFNPTVTANSTGRFVVNSGSDVNLTGSTVNLDNSSNVPLVVTSGGALDLDGAAVDINGRNGSNGSTSTLMATGDINLGSFDFDAQNLANFNRTMNLTIDGASVTSTPNDGMAGTFANTIQLGGSLNVTSRTGGVALNDIDLDILAGSGTRRFNPTVATDLVLGGDIFYQDDLIANIPGAVTLDQLTVTSGGNIDVRAGGALTMSNSTVTTNTTGRTVDLLSSGAVSLGNSTVQSQGDVTVGSGAFLDLGTANIVTPEDVVLAAVTGVSGIGTTITAPDISVHGFNGTSQTPDITQPVGGNVQIRVSNPAGSDLSVFAQNDIRIEGVAGSTITAERLGVEGTGGSTSEPAIRSTNGNIEIISDGTVQIGKGPGDGSQPLISADSNSRVLISAPQILDQNDGGGIVDVASGGEIELRTTGNIGTVANPIEAMAQDIILDGSPAAGTQINVQVSANNEYLKVTGNDSTVRVTDATTGLFSIDQVAGNSHFNLAAFDTANLYYLDTQGVNLDSLAVGTGQNLAVQAMGGNILSAKPVGGAGGPSNVDLQGSLALIASGDIGSRTQSVVVNGGTVGAQAGGEINLESNGTTLNVGDASVVDRNGTAQAQVSGFTAGSDIEVKMTANTASQLNLQSNIQAPGGVAFDVASGDVNQTGGQQINSAVVAFKVGGNVGLFDGTNPPTVVSIQAPNLALDVTGDALIQRPTGDLTVVDQATIAGDTYTTKGAGGDLRLEAPLGAINVNGNLTVGGDGALVTGANLTVGPQAAPGNIGINGNINAGGTFVIVTPGNINQTGGVVAAPILGLGAGGTIGALNPVNINANNLALNPANGNVADPNGFTAVPTATAVGVTVNQGIGPTPAPNPNPNPNANGGNGTPNPFNPALREEFNRVVDESPLAQNQIDMIEEAVETLNGPNSPGENVIFPSDDPSIPPFPWPTTDEFLQRKFRR